MVEDYNNKIAADKTARRLELKRQLAEIEEKLKRKREAEAASSLISSST